MRKKLEILDFCKLIELPKNCFLGNSFDPVVRRVNPERGKVKREVEVAEYRGINSARLSAKCRTSEKGG